MFSLASMTVRNSMLMFVAIAAAGALALAAMAFRQAHDSESLSEKLLVDVQVARAAGMADMMHDGLRANTLTARLAGPSAADAEKQAIREELAEFRKNFDEQLGIVGKHAEGEVAAALAEVKPIVQRYGQTAEALVTAALTDPPQAQPLVAAFDADFSSLEQRLDALGGLIEKAADADVVQRDELFAHARIQLLLALSITLAVLVTLGLRFANRVVRQLGGEPDQLRGFACRIADGELLVSFDGQNAHADSVAGAMLAMRDRLRDAVTTIRDGAHQVADGSAHIASGNMELATRTEQQASQLQQTAASMEEMTGSVQQTAEHARAASGLAAAASEVAVKGGEAVRRVVTTMGEIQDSSRRIAEIISVIDSIAFRTNILALNAAVEAARAGDQGRGFAVVAGEVRSLAKRSAEAAQEIKQLIDSSVERVNNGHRLVTEAGTTMEDIVTRVKRVNDLIGEISTAAAEQTGGIALAGQSMTTLDHGTQQNAALVEQTAAAASALREQSARLSAAVSVFRLTPERAVVMQAA